MTQLSFLQFGHSLENDNYAVTASFNGHPGSPGNLAYNQTNKQFEANLATGDSTETFSVLQTASSHLASFSAWDLAGIAAGSPLQLRGGGIIKTTKFPPPNKAAGAPFNPVNAGLLDDLYLSSLSILRVGSGQDFTITLEIKNMPGRNYPFQINSVSIEASALGRAMAIIFIEVGPGGSMQNAASVNYMNANTLSFNAPCSIVMDKAPLNINDDYSKSGWFYMLP